MAHTMGPGSGSTGTAPGWAPPPPSPPPWPGAPSGSPLPSPPGVPPGAAPRPRTPRPADRSPARLLGLILFSGAALDVGLRGGTANAAVALGLAALVVGLATDGRLPRRPARALALIALVPIGFLALRTSTWLAVTNLLAVAVLLAAAVAFSRSGRPTDTSVARVLQRLGGAVPSAWSAPRALAPLVPSFSSHQTSRLTRIAVAVLVCVPVLVVVAALLASADPVFAGILTPDVDLGPALGHLVLAVLLGVGVLAVIGAAAADAPDRAPDGRFGTLETVTMLVLTAAVLGLFVLAQLLALTSAGERLVEQAGLTPAEYARSGFFQLCWATGLILSLLAGIRALAAPAVRQAVPVRVLGAVVPLLALGLVAVSLRRMALYDAAFGLTMLRLWVMGAAAWMGIVLVLIALRNAGLGARRNWLLFGATAAALSLVVAADVADPEAFVARHNLARAERGAELDLDYLARLSDDATPAIVDAYASADPDLRDRLVPALRCDEDASGIARANLAAQRAASSRSAPCAALVQE